MAERPFVWANCATSLDGRLAFAGGRRARLSGPEDLRRVHLLRADSQAIVVGIGTIRADDPSLGVKWELTGRTPGPEPLRVVLDSKASVPEGARVLDGSRPTLIATAADGRRTFPRGVETFAAGSGRVDLPALLDELHRRRVHQVMVEGGAQVLASFFRAGLVDRFTVFVAPMLIGGTTSPAMLAGPETPGPEAALFLERETAEPMDDGWLLSYRPRAGPPEHP